MDDKGSTLICLFGAPPRTHQDDSARAILCAFALVSELRLVNCSIKIGITTGKVFAGVVGTSGARREFSILGDPVNLAARLM
jgi:class 3 adenylate cyclase